MKKYVFLLSIILSSISYASASDEKIRTQFGNVQIKERADGVNGDVLLNGKNVATFELNSINGFSDQRFTIEKEDVLIIYALAGAGCGSYSFLKIQDSSKAKLSTSFYSCGEISFENSGGKITTKTMNSQGKDRKKISYDGISVKENGKVLK